MIMRWNIINFFIEKYSYKSYLEIGVQQRNQNFEKINISNKFCIDPGTPDADFVGTSDEFFHQLDESTKYDIIFIDGLHIKEQVIVDIENSLKHLNENGTIICHDCLPTTELMQRREDPGGEWTGDTWKAFAHYRINSIDLDMAVVDTDYGCGIIRRGTNIPYTIQSDTYWESYSYFQSHKIEMMNIISLDAFTKKYN